MNLGDFRSQYPQYNDLSDDDLARGLHQKFYSDMPFDDFASKIGLKTGLIDRAAALFSRAPQPDTTIEDAQAAANAGEGYWTAGKVPRSVKPPEDPTGTAEQVAKAGESGLYRAGSGLLDALWGLAQSSKTDTIARGEGLSMTAADATPMGPALRGMQEAARILFPKDDAGRVQRLETAKELEAKAEAAAPRLQKTSFDDALDQGEVGSWMLVQAASQSPQYATMLATIFVPALAPVTLPLMGVQAGGNQYAENMKAGVPQDRAALDASINGLIEVASEGLTFAGAKIAAPVFKRIVDSIPDGMKRSIASNLLARAAAGAGTLGLAALGEGSSEAIGQVGQDISQREIAGRDPGDMASNARTAFFASLLPGAAFAAPGTAQGVMETPKRREAATAAGLIDAAVSGGEFITPAEEVAISRLSPDRAQLERAPLPAAEVLGEVTPEETISRVMETRSSDPMQDISAAIREAEAILAAPTPAATIPQTPYGIAPEIPVPPLSPERGYTGERGEVRPDFGLAADLQTPAAPEPQPLALPGESAQPQPLAGPASMAERQLQAEEARQRGELLTQTQIEQAAEFRARPSPEIVVGGTNYGRIEKMPEKQLQALSKLGRGKNREAALAEIQRRVSQPPTPYETTTPSAQERLQQAIAPAEVQPPSPATTEAPNALQERGAAPLDVRNPPQDGRTLAEGNAQYQAPAPRPQGADRGRAQPEAVVSREAANVPWDEVDPDRLPPPKITGTGKVVGAPPGNGRVRDRDAIVRRVLKRVALPDAMADKSIDWYEDSGKAIAAVTHGDRALTDRVARLFALYSQGNQVGGNTTATIKSLVQIARGETPAAGRFPNVTSAIVNQLLAAPEVSTKVPGVNHKIVNFYRNLVDPALGENRFPDAVTLDRWMMREFGYKFAAQGGEGGSKNLTATQYAYARDVVLRATKAYNQKHGTNIHPRQMQSLIWALHKNETGRAEREQARRGYKQEVAELGRQAKAGNELAAAELPRAESRLKDAMTPFVPKSLSFADYLKQSTALVTWETVSKRWDSIYPGIKNATPEQLKELTKSSHRILLGPDGNNALLKKVSLVPLFREEFSEGGYAGGVAPNVITGLVLEGGSNPDTKTANLAADLLGYIYHQEAVAWHLPDPNATRAQGRAAGINAVANRAVDGEALEKHLESEVPGVGFTKIGEREYRILNFRGEDGKPFSGLDDKEFGDRIVNALESFKDDVHFDAHDIVARTAYLEGGENGEGYAARIREAGRSDLLQWADDRREVLERVYRDYADRYGWGGSRAGEARGGSAAGEGARAGVTPTVTLRAQQDGAVAAVGVRYGNTKRTSLDGTHYGNGVNGAERARIEGEDNPTVRNALLNRVYFYEQTDKGSLPKSEDIVTGIQVTRARFTNLYDMSADPLGLWEAGKKRAESGEVARTASGFEMEVIERGFDGYIAKNFGPSPAIVIFTDQSFPVEYLGNRVDAARKLKAEGGNVSEGQGQYEVGERKRSYRKDDRVRRNPPRVQRGIQWRAKGIEEHLVTEGATSLVGRTIENAGDLAELAQVYRNPKYETFRMFFVNDEGVVLNATAVSSRLPGRTGIFPDNLSDDGVFDWMRDQIPDGATGFYMLHNHPSGIPTPSQDDIWATIELSKEARQRFGLRLRAHVVIDHNKYAEIFASGLNSVWDADLEGKDFNAKISEAKQNGGMLGTTLGSPEDVAYAGKLLHRGGLVTLIGHSNVGIQAIADITPEELAHPTRGWAAVRRFARQSGSMSVFAVGEDAQMGPATDNIRSMIREGFLVDAVTLEDDGYYSARAGGVEPRYAGILFGNTPTRVVKGEAPTYEAGPLWYSELSKKIEETKTETMPPKQWAAYIDNLKSKGVKADEIQWSGVKEWLELQGAKVTKAQILDYLAKNGVQVEEKMLGAPRKTTKGLDAMMEKRGELLTLWDRLDLENKAAWAEVARLDHGGYPQPGSAHEAAIAAAEAAQTRANDVARQLDDIQESIDYSDDYQSGSPTKFASYQLPGGKNYRELLLTLPAIPRASVGDQLVPDGFTLHKSASGQFTLTDEDGNVVGMGRTREGALADAGEAITVQREGQFKSSHFPDTPNILAHVRFNERADAEGKKILFIEEIQSDWAQNGKREGFSQKDAPEWIARTESGQEVGFDTEQEANDWLDDYDEDGEVVAATRAAGVPAAPFVTKTEAWVALALKRMIRYAADNGFDGIAWTTGEQQADRYDLSKQVERVVAYKRASDGGFDLSVYIKNGDQLPMQKASDKNALADIVGKDLAEKIASQERNVESYSGLDLKVGGEGMNAFYDRIVPNVVNDLLKKMGGGKVSKVPVGPRVFAPDARAGDEPIGREAQPGFYLTPEMKAKAKKGMALFQPPANYDLDFTGSAIPKGGPKGPLNISWQMLDRARRLLGELAKDDESFQFGRSDSRDWNQIVEDMGLKDITGIERIDKRHLAIRTTSMTTDPYLWEPGPPGYEEGQERPRTVYVEMKNEHLRDEDPESTVVPAVEVNSSELKTGGPGKEVYALVSTWAANNGVTFMPDWHGVSMKAVEARVAHGIAAAMRLGTTKFIWPVNPEKRFSGITIRDDSGTRVEQPPKWMYPLYEGWQEVGEPGDAADQHNQRLLIKAQLDIINGKLKKADIVDDVIGKVDNLEGLRYDFRADKIVYEATNEPVPSPTLNRIADALVPPRTKVLRDAGERGVPGEVKERGGSVGAYEPQAGSAPSGGARATAVRGIILQTALNLSPQELDQLSASVLRQRSAEGSPRRGFVSERGPAYDVGGKAPAGEQPLTPSGPVDSLLAKAGGKLAAEKITEPLYQRFLDLGKYVPERVKAGLQSDYGLPEPYIDRRDLMSINQRKGVREAMRSVELLAGLDRAQSRVAYQWMNQREAEGDALLEALPPEEREVLRTLKDTITQLGQEAVELGQLSQESYERNKMAYLHRTYAKFELTDTAQQKLARSRAIRVLGEQYKGRGLRDNVTVDKLPADVKKGDLFLRLERRTKVSDREVERGAAPGSMRLRDVKYVRADSQIPAKYEDYTTDGTWEARYMGGEKIGMWRDFTPEERKRMGELDEVKYATAKTLMMMTRDIETGRFLKWVSDTYAKGSDEDLNVVPTPTGRILTSFRADDWVQVPESKIPGTAGLKVYGELAGKYVPAPMWNDIRQAVGERYGYFGDVYNEIVRAWKISKTALSPAVHANNVMANFILADLNDVGARDIAKALKLMVDAQRGDAGAKALLDRYEESGGELGSYAVNELRNRTLEPLLDQLNREVGRADENGALLSAASLVNDLMHGRFREAYEKATQKKAWILGKKAANKMIEAYRAEDEVFRFSLWLKATAQGRSDFESGKLARKAFLDYNINAPWIQNARSTFLPFVAFSYRAGPLIVNSLAHKPWKLLKYFSVAGGLNALAYAMMGMGGGDEDKERKLLPDEKRGKTWVGNPKLMRLPAGMDEKGKLVMPWNAGIKTAAPVFMDVRRWIPMGDFFDVGQSHTSVPIPQSFVFGGPLMVMAEFMLNKQQFTGKPITLETDDKMETAAKVSGHLYKAFAPNLPGLPFTYATTAIGDAAKGATDGFGRQQSVPMAVASSVGLKVGAYPEEVLVKNLAGQKSARLYEVDKQIADARRQLRAEKISEADFEKEIERLTRKKQKIREEFAKKFD